MSQSSSPSIIAAHAVFIDSSAFFAMIYSKDENHKDAARIAQRLESEHWQLFTTNFVRAEAHALTLNKANHRVADRFLKYLAEETPVQIIRITEAEEELALVIVERYKDKDFTLTDATSFVVMERLGITNSFTFDDDFRQYGLTVLQP
jgi:uncharacterized protein